MVSQKRLSLIIKYNKHRKYSVVVSIKGQNLGITINNIYIKNEAKMYFALHKKIEVLENSV